MGMTLEQVQSAISKTCGGIPTDDQFRRYALALLSIIADCTCTPEEEGGGGSAAAPVQATWTGVTTFDVGDLTGGFDLLLDDENEKRRISIWNHSDEAILISFDGVAAAEIISANGFLVLSLTSEGMFEAGKVYVKAAAATPSAGGLIYGSAAYV